MARLMLLRPGKSSLVFPLYKELTSIGSDPRCDIILSDPLVAATHAEIQQDEQGHHLLALDSAARPVVNGRPSKRRALVDGDRIRIGTSELEFYSHAERKGSADVGRAPDAEACLHELVELSRRLGQACPLDELLAALCDSAIRLSRADAAFILLLDQGVPRIHTARNRHAEELGHPEKLRSKSALLRVAHVAEPVRGVSVVPVAAEEQATSVLRERLQLGQVAPFPLYEQGECLGVLLLGRYESYWEFSERDLKALPILASQTALLLSHALLTGKGRLGAQTSQGNEPHGWGEIIARCEAMREVFQRAERLAGATVDLLITGETGTGKELVAREIHRRSGRRADGPFVTINCAAIPEPLLESELFGHAQGAFTGAQRRKDGYFHAARGGTLFLDEIGELSPALQAKLLRVLAERSVTRLGELKAEPVDVRVIAATHRDLLAEMKAGRFREDLYWRIKVATVHLPPLRDRGDDIVLIATHLLRRLAKEHGSPVQGFSPRALEEMKRYAWPGNIRQLENQLRIAVLLADKTVLGPEDLGLGPGHRTPTLPLDEARERFEHKYVLGVVERYEGNRRAAAKALRVNPRTVFRYLERKFKKE